MLYWTSLRIGGAKLPRSNIADNGEQILDGLPGAQIWNCSVHPRGEAAKSDWYTGWGLVFEVRWKLARNRCAEYQGSSTCEL